MTKKGLCCVFILFILFAVVSAQNVSNITDVPGLETFETPEEEIAGIAPPPPPEEEIAGLETAKFDLFLHFKDSVTKNLIKDVHVQIEIYDVSTKAKTKTLRYVDDGILKLRIAQGEWEITLKVDALSTLGKDYYFREKFIVNRDMNQSIFLLPVGSVRGVVYESDKVVKGADIKFECIADYGEVEQKSTDSFGSFTAEWLPVGSCLVSAIYSNKVGTHEVSVKQGEVVDIEIELTRSMLSSYPLLIYGIIAAGAITLFFYFYKTKAPKDAVGAPEVEGKTEQEATELEPRTKDVMETLNERERVVVNFLIENGYKSTQARVHNSTGIPKTSLSRCLKSLEQKNIVQIKRIGKMKKIKLTDWFLGKE